MSFSEWKTYKLSEVINLIGGGTPKTSVSEYWNGDIPWLSVVDFGNKGKYVYETEKSITEKGLKESSTKILKKGEIIISARGTVGELAVLGREMAFNQSCYGVTAKDLAENDFLYYLLKFNIRQLKQNTHGSVFDTLTRQSFESIEVEIPDLKTQQCIASILSSLDDAIELNQQINKTLEEMAKAIFKEWFVDFNFPNATGKFQETEIGKIPVGWKVGKLGDVAEINPKLSLKKGSISKYVEMKDLSEDSSIIKNFREREFSSGSKFQNGDTLLARITPCLENGKTGLVSFLEENEIGWGSTEFIVLRGKGNVGSNFIYCLSRFEPFRNHAVKSMLGSSGRQRVVESMLIEFTLAIPPNELLINFENLVTPFFNQINNNEKENQSLSNLRDTLLPKLMKGEININL